MKSSPLRWLERALLLTGFLCLGIWAYAWLDARYTQYREGKLLDEAASARPAAAGTASQTDSLGTFREPGAARQRRSAPEGTLVGRIEIPRVGVSAIVLEGVANKTLRRGVGHIPATSLPGDSGNVGLAGHRDSFFRELKDIRKDDVITLKTLDGTYQYRVEWTKIVEPEDTEVLADTGAPVLTLVTCYPFYYVGSAPERFIVRARRTDPPEAATENSLDHDQTFPVRVTRRPGLRIPLVRPVRHRTEREGVYVLAPTLLALIPTPLAAEPPVSPPIRPPVRLLTGRLNE